MIQQFYFWCLFKGNENTKLKRCMHPVFIAALFTIGKTWAQIK